MMRCSVAVNSRPSILACRPVPPKKLSTTANTILGSSTMSAVPRNGLILTSLNLVKINPFRGTALIVLDPKMVFAVVDNFFGGTGRHAKIEGREFTATEQRIIHIVLRSVFADLREAWSHVAQIEVEYL